jgi:hypothetical protein
MRDEGKEIREKGKGKRDSSLKGELYGAQRSNKG